MPTLSSDAPITARSAVRHRPTHPDVQEWVVAPTLRASRAKPHQEPHTAGGLPSLKTFLQRNGRVSLLLGMILTLLLLWAGYSLLGWVTTVATNVEYGTPRTYQTDEFVGHESDPHTPTHFVALNQQGQIYVWELPGGNPAASRVLVGPRLSGPDAAMVPVTLAFAGDTRHPDLLLDVDGLQVRFHNTGTSYVPSSS